METFDYKMSGAASDTDILARNYAAKINEHHTEIAEDLRKLEREVGILADLCEDVIGKKIGDRKYAALNMTYVYRMAYSFTNYPDIRVNELFKNLRLAARNAVGCLYGVEWAETINIMHRIGNEYGLPPVHRWTEDNIQIIVEHIPIAISSVKYIRSLLSNLGKYTE